MAISKILHMKDCGRSFHGKHLKYALEYITVPEKTQNGRLVSAINCQVDNAFEQMKETKKKFNKTDKRQAYHIILSFKEGEVSPDTVFELTERFVKEYLGNDYEAVFAVHDNTEHPHSHIVFNSVSFRDGKKYHYQNISSYIKENKPRIVYCRVRRYKRAKMSGLQKKYYARLYRIGKLKKKAYSVAWKYRDEIKKMQKLQAQYQFLVRHDIHSVVDLALVEDNLTDKRKEASAMKSRIYRANSKNKELYDIANEMDELLECENSFRNGDVFFEDEHNRWLLLESRLKELGYSYDEVKALKEHYRSEGAKLKSLEQEASKELKLAESIRKDFVGADGQEVERQQEEVKEQNMEHEKQPRR